MTWHNLILSHYHSFVSSSLWCHMSITKSHDHPNVSYHCDVTWSFQCHMIYYVPHNNFDAYDLHFIAHIFLGQIMIVFSQDHYDSTQFFKQDYCFGLDENFYLRGTFMMSHKMSHNHYSITHSFYATLIHMTSYDPYGVTHWFLCHLIIVTTYHN